MMGIPGVPPASWPGTRPGLEPGDFPGQVKTISFKVTGSKVLKQKTAHGGATFSVGTILTDIVAFGLNDLKFGYKLGAGHAKQGATANVNFQVDGDDLLSTSQKLSGGTLTAGTITTSPNQNWKHAKTSKHELGFAVKQTKGKGTKATLTVNKIYMYPHHG